MLLVAETRLVPDRRHIPVDRRQRAGVHGHLHGPGPAADRQPVSGLSGHRRPVRRRASHDVRSGQRPAGLLDVRRKVLRHMDRHRRHVLHRVHTQPVRHIAGQIHTHQRSAQVRAAVSLSEVKRTAPVPFREIAESYCPRGRACRFLDTRIDFSLYAVGIVRQYHRLITVSPLCAHRSLVRARYICSTIF